MSIIVYYDGDCESCSGVVHFSQRFDKKTGKIQWQNIAENMDGLGIPFEEAIREFLVRDNDGKLQWGIDAFITLGQELPGWRFFASVASIPPLKMLLTVYYQFFARRHHKKRLATLAQTGIRRRKQKNTRKK